MKFLKIGIITAALAVMISCQDNSPKIKTVEYQELVTQLIKQSESFVKLAQAQKSWLQYERAVKIELQLAQITGDFTHFSNAESFLGNAFSIAPKNGGPLLTYAEYLLSLHRVNEAEKTLAQYYQQKMITNSSKPQAEKLKRNLAKAKGQYKELEKNLSKNTKSLELSIFYLEIGEYQKAENGFKEILSAEKNSTPSYKAWLSLQIGISNLHRGKFDQALKAYEQGTSYLTGWWLLEEHIAEIYALQGKYKQAQELYEDLVKRTNSPELMDALSGVYSSLNMKDQASEMKQNAKARFEKLYQEYPEAVIGHKIDFSLENDPPQKTLSLAKKNFSLRPNIEANIQLAKSFLKNGDIKSAQMLLKKNKQYSSKNPEYLVINGYIAKKLKKLDESKKYYQEALSIDPTSKERYAL